ncbi:MAG: ABC transporter permease, partial [Opitutae bacterium]|nr:ABC transporter permease [Opitutae bacterium]
MKLPWAFYLSWKQLFPTGRGISFFSVLSVFGVALGVNVMIVVVAFMNGFQDKFRTDIIDSQGHARAEMSYGSPGDWKDDMAKLESQPKVQAVAPYLNGHLLLEHFGNRAVPFAMGIDPIRGDTVIPISQFLAEGSPKMLVEEASQITPLPVVDDLQDDVVFISRK